MRYTSYLKVLLSRDPDVAGLSEPDANALFSAMLDGGVSDLELGAVITALRCKGETVDELLGFQRALSERTHAIELDHDRVRPIVLPAYGGARRGPNLLPLLALLLRRLGIPVLVHGTLEGTHGVAAAYVFRELGILPSASIRAAESALRDDKLTFVPTALIAPGLAQLMSLKGRLSTGGSAFLAAKLLDPFGGTAMLLLGSSKQERLDVLAEVALINGAHALLLPSVDGDPVAAPQHRPRIEHLHDGQRDILFEEERGAAKPVHGLIAGTDALATAEWIKSALAGHTPIPHPIVNQLACCLFACGYTDDIHQAKAIAAVETSGLAGAESQRQRTRRLEERRLSTLI